MTETEDENLNPSNGNELIDAPCLTASLPGIGGRIKKETTDFVVEELPLYEPAGEGEHLFVWIEKEDVAAYDLTRHLAKTLGISRNDVGMAGLKDRQAVTRQYVSIPVHAEKKLDDATTTNIRILKSARHRNKLKTSHLKGNRFSVLIRELGDSSMEKAQAIREEILKTGFPNYFGAQRFGQLGKNAKLGVDLLKGKKTRSDVPPSKRKFLLKMAMSAVQSALFNQIVAQRVEANQLRTALPGDVMRVNESGGLFVADESSGEGVDSIQARLDANEITPTGPLFGPKMRNPSGEVLEKETELLKSFKIEMKSFINFRTIAPGARRPLFIRPEEIEITHHSEGMKFEFELPPGTYATVLMREFMK